MITFCKVKTNNYPSVGFQRSKSSLPFMPSIHIAMSVAKLYERNQLNHVSGRLAIVC